MTKWHEPDLNLVGAFNLTPREREPVDAIFDSAETATLKANSLQADLEAAANRIAELALLLTSVCDLVDRCQIYGPADALRGKVRIARAALGAKREEAKP